MKTKKMVALAMAAVLSGSILGGCGKQAAPAEEQNTQTEGVEKETALAEGSLEVTLWHGYSADKAEKFNTLIERYNKEHPEVVIVPKFVASSEEMLPKVQAAIMNNEQPDLLWGAPTWTGVLESTGKLVDVGSIIDEEFRTDIPEGLWNVGKYNEKIYSVPVEAGTLLLIYNQDMFDEQGITTVPSTWEELYDTAQALTDGDRKGIWLPIEPNERTTWTWLCFLGQNGNELLTPDYRGVGFDRTAGIEAMDFYTKFVTEGIAPVSVGQDPFVEKQVAMVIATQGAASSYIEKYGMNVGVAMLPGNKTQATGLGSNHYFLFNNDEAKVQASMDFVKWITTGDVQAQWSIDVGYIPVSESAKNSETFQNYAKEKTFMQTAAEALTYGLARPSIEEYAKISNTISAVIEEIAYKKTSVEDGVDKIIETTNSLLQ